MECPTNRIDQFSKLASITFSSCSFVSLQSSPSRNDRSLYLPSLLKQEVRNSTRKVEKYIPHSASSLNSPNLEEKKQRNSRKIPSIAFDSFPSFPRQQLSSRKMIVLIGLDSSQLTVANTSGKHSRFRLSAINTGSSRSGEAFKPLL